MSTLKAQPFDYYSMTRSRVRPGPDEQEAWILKYLFLLYNPEGDRPSPQSPEGAALFVSTASRVNAPQAGQVPLLGPQI